MTEIAVVRKGFILASIGVFTKGDVLRPNVPI